MTKKMYFYSILKGRKTRDQCAVVTIAVTVNKASILKMLGLLMFSVHLSSRYCV